MANNSPYSLPLLIYDGECTLCVRFAQSLDRVEAASHISKAPFQDDEIYNYFPQLTKDACAEEPHLILENGEVLTGQQVIDYLIRLYPIVKNFSWLLDKEMGKKSVELFYTAASRLRKNLLKGCKKCGK